MTRKIIQKEHMYFWQEWKVQVAQYIPCKQAITSDFAHK